MGERHQLGTMDDVVAIESVPYEKRLSHATVYQALSDVAARLGDRPAVSYQIFSGPGDRAETLSWRQFHARVSQAANVFRSHGIGEADVVAYILPNANETAVALVAGLTAGIVNPINPLLEAEQIASILKDTNAKVVVTLASFPKTDVAQKAHVAAAMAGCVQTILEVDLKRYLTPPKSWLIPLIRPGLDKAAGIKCLDFNTEMDRQPTSLSFQENPDTDRISAYFHTGGTTGMPKIAQHRQRGMLYNGVVPGVTIISSESVLLCPLPMFHVMGAYAIFMSCIVNGAHMVMPTPAGYRGDGVFDNFWKLVERWGVTFMVTVPTAAAALMQRPVDANVSSLQFALCGSAPLPVGLFNRFEEATGVKILEGYGMTEATCTVSINPPDGERKIGSVGLRFPYTDVQILHCDEAGNVTRECAVDEVGEICVMNPGVFPGYTDPRRNEGLFTQPGGFLRTGDLGRLDADGYLWITGRAKDLIIRGGHNIDPALIEEALAEHPAVAFVGAIGEPNAYAGEVPCAYVELAEGATASDAELMAWAEEHVSEQAAHPKHVEVLAELPKTAVGKVFKPDLRKRAIARVYGAALAEAGIDAAIEVVEDKTRGLVAKVTPRGGADQAAIQAVLGGFARPWEMA